VATAIALLLAAGCMRDKNDPVAATDTGQGITLTNTRVETLDSQDGRECDLSGTVRNETDKTLTALVVTAFDLTGSTIAAVRIDSFQGQGSEGPLSGTVPPQASRAFFAASFRDLQGHRFKECSGIARVEPTDAIFE
jgi:hypothetical protein